MKSSFQSFVLFPAILIHCFGAPTLLDNEISHGKQDDVKSFRQEYATIMKSVMDKSVDPCDDFYEFACGNYSNALEEIEILRKRSNHKYAMNDLIEIILQKPRDPDEKFFRELQKVKQFYDSCLEEKFRQRKPREEFLEVVNAIGGFPAIDYNWNASAFDWFNMTAHLSRYGIHGLIKEEISNAHPFPPYYELPMFGFSVDVYLENIATKKDVGYKSNEREMRKLLMLYGVSRTKASRVVEDIVKFWREALHAKKSSQEYCDNSADSDDSDESDESDESDASDESDNSEYIDEHEESDDSGNSDEHEESDDSGNNEDGDDTDDSDNDTSEQSDDNVEFSKWSSFFEIAWDGLKSPSLEDVDYPCNWYWNKLDTIISQNPEAVANYLALKFLFEVHKEAESAEAQRTLCLNIVKDEIPILMSYFFINEHFKKSSADDVNSIVSEVKISMRNIIETADWIDEPTRREALKKFDALKTDVGALVDPITDTYINEINKLNLTDNFIENYLEILKFKVDIRHFGYLHPDIPKITSPVEYLNVLEYNAFYSDSRLFIYGGYLLPPAYHPYFPKFIKYGVLGGTVGHEISHAFDTGNSIYDSNRTEREWWSEKSSQTFNERINCFAEHYSNYKIPGVKQNIDGTITQDENFADNGGLRGALSAYRRVFKAAAEKQAEEFVKNESLPGFDHMSPDQMFFLSFAQEYCSDYDVEDQWNLLSDDHPWHKYRVVGPLQNSEDFSLAFNCPLGSRMNPSEKCRLW